MELDADDIAVGAGVGMGVWCLLYLFTGMFLLTVYGLTEQELPIPPFIHTVFAWVWLFTTLITLLIMSKDLEDD